MKLRVLVVDDHDVVCEGLRALVQGVSGVVVVGEAVNGREAVQKAGLLIPDLVVMDIIMPELNGIDAGRQILSQNSSIRILALSGRCERQIVLEAIRVGFRGFIVKTSVRNELETAIHAVAAGQTYLSPQLNELVLSDVFRSLSTNEPVSPNPLTGREREILQLVAEGLTSKQIGKSLNVTTKTVDAHRLQIMNKLNIRSVAGLTKYAVRCGITQP